MSKPPGLKSRFETIKYLNTLALLDRNNGTAAYLRHPDDDLKWMIAKLTMAVHILETSKKHLGLVPDYVVDHFLESLNE